MKKLFFTFGLWCFAASSGEAISIELDYSFDQAAKDFFGQHENARAVLQQAAADLNALLETPLEPVRDGHFMGAGGEKGEATIDWRFTVQNPATGETTMVDGFPFEKDALRLYVGARPLDGETLGEGGPAGAGVSLGGSGESEDAMREAFARAEAESNKTMSRGGGPIVGELSGDFVGRYQLRYGTFLGNLWFDNDTDNDSKADSDERLNEYWNFELKEGPKKDQFDFYSVALHEMLHALGFGASQSWEELHSGTDWLGARGRELDGKGGVGLVTADGHIREDYFSTSLVDGGRQVTVMSPSLVAGERRSLTAMDEAILQDLGYRTVPEPSALWLSGCGGVWWLFQRRRRG